MVDQTEHVYPMIGPGMGYKEMITGKWIPARDTGDRDPEGGGTPTGYF